VVLDVVAQFPNGSSLKPRARKGGLVAQHIPPHPSTRVYLGFLAVRSDLRMIKTKRATINRNSHGPRDESPMNPDIAFSAPLLLLKSLSCSPEEAASLGFAN
jgi:hypothetical protein